MKEKRKYRWRHHVTESCVKIWRLRSTEWSAIPQPILSLSHFSSLSSKILSTMTVKVGAFFLLFRENFPAFWNSCQDRWKNMKFSKVCLTLRKYFVIIRFLNTEDALTQDILLIRFVHCCVFYKSLPWLTIQTTKNIKCTGFPHYSISRGLRSSNTKTQFLGLN